MPRYQRLPYTHDLYPGAQDWENDSDRANYLEAQFRDLCRLYGISEIRTPAFEFTDLFTRSIGDDTDIVSKEMYTFTDRGDRSNTLRPEGTAPALRAYLENGLHAQGGVSKLYYIASVFRYERGQKGRYRQHEQLGVEALGSDDPALDAEIIQLAMAFFRRIGINNLNLRLNSVGSPETRAGYLDALKAFVAPHLHEFSEEGQRRFEHNPLRLLDTKNPRELDILGDAPALTDYLSTDEAAHFETLRGYLDDAGVAYTLDPRLVRGFDYYTNTAFEIQSPDLGAQNALGGGGRYNGLIEQIGGPPTAGIGFGLGLERALIALQALAVEMPSGPAPAVYVVTLGDAARKAGVHLLVELRNAGISADIEYGGRSMKAQMRGANRSGARFAAILGDDEVAGGIVQLKDLASSEQQVVNVADLAEHLKIRLSQAS